MNPSSQSKQHTERGIALIFTLILLFVLSVIAASLFFLSQTETWSSMNYRLLTQARYGAETGVEQAANYLMNTYSVPPVSGDPLTNYTFNVANVSFPTTGCGSTVTTLNCDPVGVTYSTAPVVLSADSTSSNYPSSTVQSAFNTNTSGGKGSMTLNNITVNYTSHAVLLSMENFTPPSYLTGQKPTVQTWRVTGDGTVSSSPNAQVEVSAILEQPKVPVFAYAAFATNSGCSALQFGGGGNTNSYDSTQVVNGTATFTSNYGNVGTNGNLTTNGNPTVIDGTLSTPRTGVGGCTSNAVTGFSGSGSVSCGSGTTTSQCMIQLPQPITYPTPVIPAPGSNNLSIGTGYNCPSGSNAINVANGYSGACATSSNDVYLPPGNYGNISLNGKAVLHLSPGTYNINSLQEAGNNTGVVIDQSPCTSPCVIGIDATPGNGPVQLNVTGTSVSGNVVDLTGNSVQNPSLNPQLFLIAYAGTGTIALKGNSDAAGVVYAPNASYSFTGNSDWYGSVIGAQMTDMGGTSIHYDRHLQKTDYMAGNYSLSAFTWKKY